MHIGIDALFRLLPGAGLIHLTRIVSAWRDAIPRTGDRLTIFTTADGATALESLRSPGVTFRVYDWPGRGIGHRFLWEQVRLLRIVAALDDPPDVLFCSGNMAPLWSAVPIVLVLRSVALFCQDMPLTIYRRGIGQMMRLSARQAVQVIGNSAVISTLVTESFGVNSAHVNMIHYGCDQASIPDNAPVSPSPYTFPYLLCISAIRRYKCMSN